MLDKHKHAKQPNYNTNEKVMAREQIVIAYRAITKNYSLPEDKGYWTFCRDQTDGKSEINQLLNCGLIQKKQFFGIDYDIENNGYIKRNKIVHPEANWFDGEWLEVIEENYEVFNPGLIHFDYTKTVVTTACHVKLAKTMNLCPSNTVVAANLMLSDGHSSKRFNPNLLIENLGKHLRSKWIEKPFYYSYKGSETEMATYFFWR